MDSLPKEIINKIFFFISHPVADIFKIEFEYAAEVMRTNCELNIRCNCCANFWSECRCVCSNCFCNYRDCRDNCLDNRNRGRGIHKR